MNGTVTLDALREQKQKSEQQNRHEQRIREAMQARQQNAENALKRLKIASNGVDAETGMVIWASVEYALTLAEMALEGHERK